MTACAHAGIPPHEALNYTPRMIGWVLDAHVERMRQAAKDHITLAYRIEGFARTKRLPDIRQLLRKLDPPRVMSGSEQRAEILGVARAIGAPVRYVPKGSIKR